MKHLLTGIAALFAATSLLVPIEAAADTWIEQFIFKCEVPSEEIRVEDVRAGVFSYSETGHVIPRDGKIGGIFYGDVRDAREDCRDEINRLIIQCKQNTLFLSPPFDPTSEIDEDELDKPIHGRCYPILERQRGQCVEHFERERDKCNAGSDDTSREVEASDARQHDEEDAGEADEDGSLVSDTWKPWGGEAATDDSEDSQWDEVEDSNEGQDYKPDDASDNCEDVWSDCPVDTYWTDAQQEGARQVELWVNYADPQADAEATPQDSDWGDEWGYEADAPFGTTSEGEDATHRTQEDDDNAREEYERELAGLLNEDGPSVTDLYSVSDGDYRAALEQMEAKAEAEERARIEAERAATEAAAERERREAERRAQEAANRQSGTDTGSSGGGLETEGDGNCGSAPACRNYIRHGEQVLAQVSHIRPTSMTDGALNAAFVSRSTLGCLRKCLPHETSNSCINMLRSAISELENTYRSAIESAKGSSADSSYVDEFDRNPGSSQFVRNFGIQVSGAGLDSCGD